MSSVIDFSIFRNIIIIETTQYILIDNYTYSNGNFMITNSQPFVIRKSGPGDIAHVSNPFFINNKLYSVKVSQIPRAQNDDSQFDAYYYELFAYNLNTNKHNFVTSIENTPVTFFTDNFNFDTSAFFTDIKNCILTYNSKLDLFNITTHFADLTGVPHIHTSSFNIRNNNIRVVTNDLFSSPTQLISSRSENLYSGDREFATVSLTDETVQYDTQEGSVSL